MRDTLCARPNKENSRMLQNKQEMLEQKTKAFLFALYLPSKNMPARYALSASLAASSSSSVSAIWCPARAARPSHSARAAIPSPPR